MTETNTPGAVEIEQVDRKLLASIIRQYDGSEVGSANARNVLDRNHDDDAMLREIAAFRLSAQSPAPVSDADVERVALALCLASGDDPDREGPWDTWWRGSAYDIQARAAIAAMQAPATAPDDGERG